MADILQEKAYRFALRAVKLSEYLHNEKNGFVLSRKALDSGTNIALFIEEAKQGENRPDCIQKFSLANKEAFKSHPLIRLLNDAGYVNQNEAESLLKDCGELQGLLIASLRTARWKE